MAAFVKALVSSIAKLISHALGQVSEQVKLDFALYEKVIDHFKLNTPLARLEKCSASVILASSPHVLGIYNAYLFYAAQLGMSLSCLCTRHPSQRVPLPKTNRLTSIGCESSVTLERLGIRVLNLHCFHWNALWESSGLQV